MADTTKSILSRKPKYSPSNAGNNSSGASDLTHPPPTTVTGNTSQPQVRPIVRDVVVERRDVSTSRPSMPGPVSSTPSPAVTGAKRISDATQKPAPTDQTFESNIICIPPQQPQQPQQRSQPQPQESKMTGRNKSTASGGPTVIQSISQLVALAQGTSEEAAQGIDVAEIRRKQEAGEEVALETDMAFACMTEEEYKETLEMAERMEIGSGEQKQKKKQAESNAGRDASGRNEELVERCNDIGGENDEGQTDEEEEGIIDVNFEEGCALNNRSDEPTMEEVFFGRQDIFGEDTDDVDDSENEERAKEYEGDGDGDNGRGQATVGGGFMDFFGADDDDSLGEPEPAPKPFLRYWNALSSWITPETALLLEEWNQSNNKRINTGPDVTAFQLRQPYDTSDVGSSRCGGLMSMLKMNLPRALEELGFEKSAGHVRRLSEGRLANFCRTFNYSDPMVKFDSTLWKGLTIVFVDICFPAAFLYPDVAEHKKTVVPATITQLGITDSEYNYLTKSAIGSLNAGGA